MKTLVFGIVLIVLLGVAGFFYRNVMESAGTPEPVACTMDAKVCPDGSAVGRVAPSCAFPACPLPNAEVSDAGIGFVIPDGYVADDGAYGADETLLAAYMKNGTTTSVSSIAIRRYALPEGKTADEVILGRTRYQPADMQAEDFERFDEESIGGNTYKITVIERFEGLVESAYFLKRADDVLAFFVVEKDVTDWMDPDLEVQKLPEHQALRTLLSTLVVR